MHASAMAVHSEFDRAFASGTRFRPDRGGEPITVATHSVGALEVPSGRIGAADPFTMAWREPDPPFARTAPTGTFPVELAVARFTHPGGIDERVACARVRFSDRRAIRWEMALFEGQAPVEDGMVAGYGVDTGTGCFFDAAARADVDEAATAAWLAACEKSYRHTWSHHTAAVGGANVVMFSSGIGDGFYASWWGLDEAGAPAELVTDFETLVGSTSETIELDLPLPRGRFRHPLLERHGVVMSVPLLSRTTVTLGGSGAARVELSDGSPVEMNWQGGERVYRWERPKPTAKLRIHVMTGVKPLEVVG